MRRRTGGRQAACAALTVLSLLVGMGLGVGWGTERTSAQAAEPAQVTLLNVSEARRTVQVRAGAVLGDGESVRTVVVEPFSGTTVEIAAPDEPVEFNATCSGCRGVAFAAAAGQRVIVVLVALADPVVVRSDLTVANESGRRQRGALRTGDLLGRGRSVLDFDLAAGESASVGLRFPAGRLLDLNLTCDGCVPQRVRAGNAVDLEIVIR